MAIKGASVAYLATGGLVMLSGIKGSTLADTVKAVLSGNLTLSDTETIASNQGDTSASGTSANGAAILADAQKYNGHKYVYGGPSNPATGWDCSSFVSYVLGHDEGLPVPGGSWASVTGSGSLHGPTTTSYLSWSGATTVPAAQVQPGDLLCWPTHIGFAVDATHMFSAYDTASGTVGTAWSGPSGEGAPVVRRVNGTAITAGSTGGSVSPASVLAALGAPASSANITSLTGWFAREGTKAAFNPMATTESEPGATQFNSAGVKNYPDAATGVKATVATLENGQYPAIVMALRAGQGLAAGNGQVQQELLTWSGGGYSSV